jgi:hypothetical protein
MNEFKKQLRETGIINQLKCPYGQLNKHYNNLFKTKLPSGYLEFDCLDFTNRTAKYNSKLVIFEGDYYMMWELSSIYNFPIKFPGIDLYDELTIVRKFHIINGRVRCAYKYIAEPYLLNIKKSQGENGIFYDVIIVDKKEKEWGMFQYKLKRTKHPIVIKLSNQSIIRRYVKKTTDYPMQYFHWVAYYKKTNNKKNNYSIENKIEIKKVKTEIRDKLGNNFTLRKYF